MDTHEMFLFEVHNNNWTAVKYISFCVIISFLQVYNH